jgi:hypothetical protein
MINTDISAANRAAIMKRWRLFSEETGQPVA